MTCHRYERLLKNRVDMESLETRDYSFKELPTKELKLRRHKDRRDSPNAPPIRLRLKSNSFPFSETDMDKCLSDRSVSSSPENFIQEQSSVFNSSPPTNSLPSSPLESEGYDSFILNSPPKYVQNEDYDKPLDMSRKRFHEPLSPSKIKEHHSPQQQVRPSVITCASALLRTQCSLSDLAHQMCVANVNDCKSNDINPCIMNKINIQKNEEEIKEVRQGHRREIVSGSCDPVIDEHFRRSLGKDYQQIFSKSSGNNVSITVDDHFAKALGETWRQIQESKVHSSETLSPAHSSSSMQTSQNGRLIPQPPEILS